MTEKEQFINEIISFMSNNKLEFSDEANKYFEKLQSDSSNKENDNSEITKKGRSILTFMQENHEQYNNLFSAKIIGEGLFMAPRSVSGSMRKLISCGYAEKVGQNPVMYKLTDVGVSI